MKLFGVAMVRNEADIIETFVRHNLTVLEGLAIVDHGSWDGTSGILAALVAEGLPVVVGRDDSIGQYQSAVTTHLVRDAFGRTSSDFVCALDADEFLKVPSRPLLEGALQQVPVGVHLLLEWQTYVPDFAAVDSAGDVRKCIAGARRVAQEAHGLHKVVVARHFLENGSMVVATGNHAVLLPAAAAGPRPSTPHLRMTPEVLAVAHVPVRSRDQFTAKIAVGWLATLAARAGPTNVAFHWGEAYDDLVAGKELTPERLTEIAANYGVARTRWRPAGEIARVDDPFLADIDLRYTGLARRDPLVLVLAFAAKLAARR